MSGLPLTQPTRRLHPGCPAEAWPEHGKVTMEGTFPSTHGRFLGCLGFKVWTWDQNAGGVLALHFPGTPSLSSSPKG